MQSCPKRNPNYGSSGIKVTWLNRERTLHQKGPPSSTCLWSEPSFSTGIHSRRRSLADTGDVGDCEEACADGLMRAIFPVRRTAGASDAIDGRRASRPGTKAPSGASVVLRGVSALGKATDPVAGEFTHPANERSSEYHPAPVAPSSLRSRVRWPSLPRKPRDRLRAPATSRRWPGDEL